MRGPLWWWRRRRHRAQLRPVEAIEIDVRRVAARLAATTDHLCSTLELASRLPSPTEGDTRDRPR